VGCSINLPGSNEFPKSDMSLGKFANYLWNRISKGQEWDWLSDPFWRVQTLAIFFVVGLVGLIFRMRPPGGSGEWATAEAAAWRCGSKSAALVDGLRSRILGPARAVRKPITMAHEVPMLPQLLVRAAVSVCNIAVHAPPENSCRAVDFRP
jgi:hypothetical protein